MNLSDIWTAVSIEPNAVITMTGRSGWRSRRRRRRARPSSSGICTSRMARSIGSSPTRASARRGSVSLQTNASRASAPAKVSFANWDAAQALTAAAACSSADGAADAAGARLVPAEPGGGDAQPGRRLGALQPRAPAPAAEGVCGGAHALPARRRDRPERDGRALSTRSHRTRRESSARGHRALRRGRRARRHARTARGLARDRRDLSCGGAVRRRERRFGTFPRAASVRPGGALSDGARGRGSRRHARGEGVDAALRRSSAHRARLQVPRRQTLAQRGTAVPAHAGLNLEI